MTVFANAPGLRQARNFYGSARRTSLSLGRIEQVIRRQEAIQRTQPASESPIDQFISMSYATRTDGLFDGTYDLWRVKRISKILEIFGIDYFEDRRVLELGAGHGDIGALLASLGAEVTCVEGRTDNLNFGRLKHRQVERLSFVNMDLDNDFRSLGSFDLVLHFGLLYHIENVDRHLGRCFDLTDDLILESVVCDSTDPTEIFVIDENAEVNEEALNGRGSRPSPFYIERLADGHGFSVERHFTSDLNSSTYIYDWAHTNNPQDDLAGFNRRRFWRMQRVGQNGRGA